MGVRACPPRHSSHYWSCVCVCVRACERASERARAYVFVWKGGGVEWEQRESDAAQPNVHPRKHMYIQILYVHVLFVHVHIYYLYIRIFAQPDEQTQFF